MVSIILALIACLNLSSSCCLDLLALVSSPLKNFPNLVSNFWSAFYFSSQGVDSPSDSESSDSVTSERLSEASDLRWDFRGLEKLITWAVSSGSEGSSKTFTFFLDLWFFEVGSSLCFTWSILMVSDFSFCFLILFSLPWFTNFGSKTFLICGDSVFYSFWIDLETSKFSVQAMPTGDFILSPTFIFGVFSSLESSLSTNFKESLLFLAFRETLVLSSLDLSYSVLARFILNSLLYLLFDPDW